MFMAISLVNFILWLSLSWVATTEKDIEIVRFIAIGGSLFIAFYFLLLLL